MSVPGDIFGRYQQGLEFGRGIRAENEQRQQRSRLSELAQTAYGAPDIAGREAAIGEAIGVDPQAGFALGQNVQGIEDRKRKALVESAGFLGRLPPEQQAQAYAGIRGRLAQSFPDIQLPEDWMQAAPTVAAINQAYGPGTDLGDRYRVVGNTLVDLQNPGQAVYRAPQVINADQGIFEYGQGGLRPLGQGATSMDGGQIGPIGDVQPGTGFTVDPSIPPQVAAQIAQQEAAAGGVQQGQIPQTGGVPILTPQGSGARAEQLRLAQEANARAAEAAARAARAEDRATQEAEIRRRLGATPPGFRVNAAGTAFEPSPGGPKPAGATATEGERKSAVLLKRLEGSLGQLQTAVGQTPGAASPSLTAETVRRIPFVGGDTAANVFTGQGRQRVEAAQLDILDAALTLGTGAAYTREQLEGYRRSFFPQIGDSRETIADKQARLDNVIAAARIAAGRAAPESGQSAPQGGPTPGTIQDGYRFRGGNPADPSSWEEVR
jgi:hypothetical protein